jgi:hypothetical protein
MSQKFEIIITNLIIIMILLNWLIDLKYWMNDSTKSCLVAGLMAGSLKMIHRRINSTAAARAAFISYSYIYKL